MFPTPHLPSLCSSSYPSRWFLSNYFNIQSKYKRHSTLIQENYCHQNHIKVHTQNLNQILLVVHKMISCLPLLFRLLISYQPLVKDLYRFPTYSSLDFEVNLTQESPLAMLE